MGRHDTARIQPRNHPSPPHTYSGVILGKTIYPGKGLGVNDVAQFEEKEVLTHEDYDLIIKLGWNGFREKIKDRFNPHSEEKIVGWAANQMEQYKYEIETWEKRGLRT
ncbi:MAG: hypothetical protein JRI85_14095, partial [Deltaproteobacteria bacterium]|nr:hypothetical protein [Deltaproteobacteria bacterium]